MESVPSQLGNEDRATNNMNDSAPFKMNSSEPAVGMVTSQSGTYGATEGPSPYHGYLQDLPAYLSHGINSRKEITVDSGPDHSDDSDIADGSDQFTKLSGVSVLRTSWASSGSAGISRVRSTREHIALSKDDADTNATLGVEDQAIARRAPTLHVEVPIRIVPEPPAQSKMLSAWPEWIQDMRPIASAFVTHVSARMNNAINVHLMIENVLLAGDGVMVALGLLEPTLNEDKIRLRWRCVSLFY